MSSTTMHFGPEWMRTKHQPLSRSQPPPSPPPSNLINNSGASTYSALVSATPTASSEASDDAHPFRYSKDELLRIYQEGGKGGLGLEVERWEGVVREAGAEPIALREMTEAEKKLFAGPLNSELRRRPSQSTDFLSPLNTSTLERPRLTHSTSATANSPLRERFGALKRRDSGATGSLDATLLSLPRKPSLSALQAPSLSPRDVSPRTRVGYTPSFDGVLNNGESWIARRRISESSLKAAAAASGPADSQSNKASGIREEKEVDQGHTAHLGDNQNTFSSSSPHLNTEDSVQYDSVGSGPENLNGASQPNHFVANGVPNLNFFAGNHMDAGPPPGLVDLAAVEWMYKDPTGQIQGPFRADLMQKWYNDGYFSSDLPMKRVVYDTHWSTVEELIQRANGENIFMSPLLSSLPPSRGTGSPLQPYPSSDNLFNEPYQPAPIRTLRTSTLESYLTGGSLPSDSPSSSIGASHFGNPSPDPGAFGGRDVKPYFGNDHLGSRLPAYGMQEYIPAYGDRRPIGHEHPNNGINLQQGPFSGFLPDRDLNFNGHGYTPAQVSHDSWMMGSNIPSSMYAAGREYIGRTENAHHDSVPRTFNGALYTNDNLGGFNGHITGLNEGHHGYSHYDYPAQPAFQNIPQDQAQMASPARDFAEHIPQSNPLTGFRNLSIDSVVPKSPQNDNSGLPSVPVQSPWKVLPEASTSHVPDITGPISQSSWNPEPVSLPAAERKDASPSMQLANGDASRQTGVPTSSAKSIQEPTAGVDVPNKKIASPTDRKVHSRDPSESTPTSELSAPQGSQNIPKTQPKVSPPSPTSQLSPTESPVIPPAPKTAWAKEEEGKKKKAPVPSISLREIQEAEVKKLEFRKNAEREKEKLARVSATVESKEDIQSFTTSWGLPTSQAGSRASVPVREIVTPSAQSPATTPVWTTSLKQPAVKKTMKEIQEEEESRRKMTMKEVATPVVTKRGYAETTTKVAASPPVATANNVWTTVGPSGKTSNPVVPSPVRSVAQTTAAASTSSATSLSRSSNSPIQRAPISAAMKTRPVVTKADDVPDTLSHDFLKWISDSLKGLNSSVNVEEIISMLLSFPLDPDATTMEIISDTIYSNSTTLDGRRFATEFVSKRKADARSKASTSGKAKPVSIADVVKATPKATQQEWGFKVVNKKKKGGRA